MLYIKISPKDCHNMFLFKYYWYYSKYFRQLYFITKMNLSNIEFGNIRSTFRCFFNAVLFLPTTIMIEYNLTFKDKYDRYQEFRESL